MKIRTEVAIMGSADGAHAEVGINATGGLVWTMTANGRRVIVELENANEATQLVVPLLLAAGASSFAHEQAMAAARLAAVKGTGLPQ